MRVISQNIHKLYCLDNSDRNKAIEGLRALAVLMVFNTHVLSYFYFNNFFIDHNSALLDFFKFLQSGHFGVDIFFVISGYLIYKTTVKSNPSVFIYFRRRFMRLMPAHLVVLALVIPSGFLWINAIENVFFLTAFVKNIPNYNFVTWSLGWEWLFYLIFYILFRLFGSAPKLYFLGIAIFELILIFMTFPGFSVDSQLKGSYDIPIPGRFFGFFIGGYAAQISESSAFQRSKKLVSIASMVGVFGFIYLIWIYSVYRETPNFNSYAYLNLYFLVLDLTVAVILLGFIFSNRSVASTFFSFAPFRILGQVSYSFYLIHACIGIPMAMQFIEVRNFGDMCNFYLLSFIFCFAISSISFLIFERPILSKK